MALGSDTKLYIALGVLAALGGAFYLQQENQKKDTLAHSQISVSGELPKLEFSDETKGKVTKLVIEKPAKAAKDDDKAEAPVRHVLEKQGETWRLVEPVAALANQSNVDSALSNLAKTTVKERVAAGTGEYATYDLSDDKALHIQAFEGDKVVLELWSGKSGGRGQLGRVGGQDGVFSLDGFSSYSFNRDTKGWRDLKIVEIATDAVTGVTIAGEKGEFAFKKEKDAWTGKFKKPKGPALAAIKDFDAAKVDDLLRAYKTLNATAFGDDKTLEETGLDKPLSTLTIQTSTGETRILYGQNSEGSARWIKVDGKEPIYAIGSWAADWAFAEESKFQKKKDAKKGDDSAEVE